MSDVPKTSKTTAEGRRPRFEPKPPRYGLSPAKVRLLALIAECQLLTTRQCGLLLGSGKSATASALRDMFDGGYTERFSIPYVAMMPRGTADKYNGTLHSEMIHLPTRKGLDFLAKWTDTRDDITARAAPKYGVENYLFVAHEVLCRDVRVWLELCARTDGGTCEWWVHGTDAHVPPATSDALFMYRLAAGGMRVGLVEADAGTERQVVWEEKVKRYTEMLASGRLADVTGGRKNGKVIVVTRDAQRRDQIAKWLAGTPLENDSYLCDRDDLLEGGMARPVWRRPGKEEPEPFHQ